MGYNVQTAVDTKKHIIRCLTYGIIRRQSKKNRPASSAARAELRCRARLAVIEPSGAIVLLEKETRTIYGSVEAALEKARSAAGNVHRAWRHTRWSTCASGIRLQSREQSLGISTVDAAELLSVEAALLQPLEVLREAPAHAVLIG